MDGKWEFLWSAVGVKMSHEFVEDIVSLFPCEGVVFIFTTNMLFYIQNLCFDGF